PVIAECGKGFQWHGVDRVRADQLLDIDNIWIRGVLRTGAAPQNALHTDASITEFGKALSTENIAEFLVDHLRIRNRDFSSQIERLRRSDGFQITIDHRVYPAHKY